MFDIIQVLFHSSGFLELDWYSVVMLLISFVFMYLAIAKHYEPYLLLPIAFGMFLANLPITGMVGTLNNHESIGLLDLIYKGGIKTGLFPPLIFLAVGAMTDFGPLIANPISLILGAAAQFGIYLAFIGAIALGFNGNEAASIGIIGGADGPTAIYLTSKLAPELLSSIALAAYSYMALIPVIQPPIIKLLTNKKERQIQMAQLRVVSKREKIIFPVLVAGVVILLLPSTAPLIGMLMFGNLIKESGVIPNIEKNVTNAFLYVVTVFLGLAVGSRATAEVFLTSRTLLITALGLLAFGFGTFMGVVFGKILCKLSGGKINPMIGAAGVSAVPMAARVVQKLGQDENPSNFLLMHAMGPNVAGVIGSAVAAGIFLSM